MKRPLQSILVVLKNSSYQRVKESIARTSESANVAQTKKLHNYSNPPIEWLRMIESRHRRHEQSVSEVLRVLQNSFNASDTKITVLTRDNLTTERYNLCRPELVISVGGDGTCLSSSRYVCGLNEWSLQQSNSTPLLCVNSDPHDKDDCDNTKNSRRAFGSFGSFGELCCCTATNFNQYLSDLLNDDASFSLRSRILVQLIRGNGLLSEDLALNDVLVAHKDPAVTSRFSMHLLSSHNENDGRIHHNDNNNNNSNVPDRSSEHIRSSGFRVCTPTGSTAAMLSAGGFVMEIKDKESIQYMISGNQSIEITWNSFCGDGSGDGVVYVDGAERKTTLEIGDSAVFTTKNAPRLPLYEKKR